MEGRRLGNRVPLRPREPKVFRFRASLFFPPHHPHSPGPTSFSVTRMVNLPSAMAILLCLQSGREGSVGKSVLFFQLSGATPGRVPRLKRHPNASKLPAAQLQAQGGHRGRGRWGGAAVTNGGMFQSRRASRSDARPSRDPGRPPPVRSLVIPPAVKDNMDPRLRAGSGQEGGRESAGGGPHPFCLRPPRRMQSLSSTPHARHRLTPRGAPGKQGCDTLTVPRTKGRGEEGKRGAEPGEKTAKRLFVGGRNSHHCKRKN